MSVDELLKIKNQQDRLKTLIDSLNSYGASVLKSKGVSMVKPITIYDIINKIPYIDNGNESDYFDIVKLIIEGKTEITNLIIPNQIINISSCAFSDCIGFENITIPDSVTTIGDRAFSNCTTLQNITIPDSVTSIGVRAFYNTAYYNDDGNWTDGVLYIGNHLIEAKTTISGAYTIKSGTKTIVYNAFSNCDGLTSITIPDSMTSIGDDMFAYCASLTSVTIGNSVTSIGEGAFRYCSSLTNIIIPDSVTKIGYGAFQYCSNLTSITFGDDPIDFDGWTFEGCTSLENVYIKSIDSWCKISGYNELDSPLYYAKNLYLNGELVTDLIIPNNVTSISNIAFNNYMNLTSVTILNNTTSVPEWAFWGCSNLTIINVPWSEGEVSGAPWGATNATINYNYIKEE